MTNQDFEEKLRQEFTDVEGSQDLLRQYFSESGNRFTGSQFEQLCDSDNPNTITANDILAVGALSVEIPVRTALWILGDEGSEKISAILRNVRTDIDIWHPDARNLLAEGGPLWELWDLLSIARWPVPQKSNDMGQTKISKLIAAKRPRLSPVLDSVITGTVFPGTGRYWEAFRFALSNDELRDHIVDVTSIPEVPADISLLRRIDVVLWSRHR